MQEPPDQQPAAPVPLDTETSKETIFAAIAKHLREHGPTDWHLVCEQPEFAHVIGKASGPSGARRFWRWRKKAAEDMPADRTRPHEGRATNDEHRGWAEEQVRRAAMRNLPAAPPASFFMERGADGLIKVDMLAAVGEVWSDLQMVRERALGDASDTQRPASAKLLAETAMARMKVLASVVQLQREIHDIDNLHRLYRAIFDFLNTALEAHPELHREFLRVIAEMNCEQPLRLVSEGR